MTGCHWLRGETIAEFFDGHDTVDVSPADGRSVEDHGIDLWEAHLSPARRLAAIQRDAAALAEARELLDLAVRKGRAWDPALS